MRKIFLSLAVVAAAAFAGCDNNGGSDEPRYTVTLQKVGNGTVQSNYQKSYEGQTILISADPADGNVFDGWSVESGEGVSLTNASAEQTSFTMPASNVVLKATFVESSAATGDFRGALTVNPVSFSEPDVDLSFIMNERAGTADIVMPSVKFATPMPRINMTIPGITAVEDNGTITLGLDANGTPIVPIAKMGSNSVPFPDYTMTAISGTVTAEGMEITMTLGAFSVHYVADREQ